jgi:hypothetical protein
MIPRDFYSLRQLFANAVIAASRLAPMTVSSPNVTEIKLDRLIDDMRL